MDEDGAKVTKRLTTQRIRTLIQAGQISEDYLGRHGKTDKKRPLKASRSSSAACAKMAKASADHNRSGKFKDLYKDIAAPRHSQRHGAAEKKAWKPIKDWGMLLIWLAVIAGVLYGGYRIINQYI